MPVLPDADPANAIKRVATELWSDHGYGSVPIAEICRSANVSNGTFFYHYKSASALGLAVLTDLLPCQTFINLLILHDGSTWDYVDLAFEQLGEIIQSSDLALFRTVIAEQAGSEVVWGDDQSLPHLIRYVILRGQKRGELGHDLPLDDTIALTTSTIVGAMVRWAGDDNASAATLGWVADRVKALIDVLATPERMRERRPVVLT